MSAHDKMCPTDWRNAEGVCIYCDMIARVRADQDRRNAERDRLLDEDRSTGWHMEYLEDGIKAAVENVAKVEALLEKAKAERDTYSAVQDARSDPDAYGRAMWLGGRVTGITEALLEVTS